ncbi:MAG: hypothetical protein E6G07_00180 [Actinobacteria bacterium]|nr:MAG: hypothetical protein E6G07_00180 [Actinomycetota bacterium]
MAVPRPVLLALLGLGLIASVFLVTRSGSNESVSAPSHAPARPMPAPARPAPAQPHKPATAPSAAKAHPAPAKNVPARRPDKPAAKPAPVAKAPAPTGLRAAVDSLRGVPRVHVFDASLDEVAAFRPMLSDIGITQVPSTVIVRPGRKAVLIQGFVDGGTLRQNVADALR